MIGTSIRGGGHGNTVTSFLTDLGEKGPQAKHLEGALHDDGNHRKDRNSPIHLGGEEIVLEEGMAPARAKCENTGCASLNKGRSKGFGGEGWLKETYVFCFFLEAAPVLVSN